MTTHVRCADWAGVSAAADGKPKLAAGYLQNALAMDPSSAKNRTLFDKVCKQANTARPYYEMEMEKPVYVPKAHHGPKPPTPEPEPEPEKEPPASTTMPSDWEHIDISDIVYEQTLLRDSILAALDGKFGRDEVTIITNMMKRAGHTKDKIKHVEEALGDGDLDDEDLALMNSLLPPEAYNDWMRMLHTSDNIEGTEDTSLESNFGYWKTLFRRYALEGTVGMDDVEDMGTYFQISTLRNFPCMC
jgi:hypothetical protein